MYNNKQKVFIIFICLFEMIWNDSLEWINKSKQVLTELATFKAEFIIVLLVLLLLLVEVELINCCLWRGDLGLCGVRLTGDMGGECRDGGDLDLKLLAIDVIW